MLKPVKAGIIGCGNISEIYFLSGKKFEILEIVACADLVPERAKDKAERHGCRACSVEELLADPDIEIVINLTIPKAHAEVALAALGAGKNVHGEKPLAVTRDQGQQILELAKEKGLLVGSAPDTFMGSGIQTSLKLINDGWIGEPVAASAFMLGHGHETWHPDPEFYYKPGGGPMFDMGPYYLTALVTLVGPVKKVAGMTRVTFPERTVTSKPKYGTKIQVEVPTHVAGSMEFANGAIGTVNQSFDVWTHNMPCIEVYGTEGSITVPDPNGFGGTVKVARLGMEGWRELPLCFPYKENSRGIGVADMAYALRTGRKHRASGEMANHVLDIMHGFHDAGEAGKHVKLKTTCKRPAPLPLGLREGLLDE